ncbi:transporter substrate-binding domain-containing protein [Sodalis ligni]|uniref:Polar amino acid transport system substrate-binding protein n=1 Tax=Sodalis ligni TaxID=2697027 RepID=A0A4R1NEZ7_9GAMM|nr:transporter substrate-binding domain-containing protein [Sodalis ligni]QWA11144.1 transporter substrate-binding domain-containing protein [Sodalis ligni]TCL05497.1 polar amino acid transport system substrate-binding protein [Sodalis ligni]
MSAFLRLSTLAAAIFLFGAQPASAGSTLDRVNQSKVLHDVLVNDYPPFGFIDENNQLAGFDVDVAKAVAQKLGVTLELTAPGWETIVGGKWNGRWDVCICSMTPNSERAKVLDFPAPYYSSPAVLVVNKDEKNIKSAADLSNKKVGVGIGSSYENYLNKTLVIPGAKPIDFPFNHVQIIPTDETVAFQNLALGAGTRLDAVVSDLATAKARIAKTSSFRIAAELYAEPNWVATDKGDAEWNKKVADTINALRADGTLAKISQHWFGEDITRASL